MSRRKLAGKTEKLQAVLVASTPEMWDAWLPLSLEVPPAMLPVANVPLIEYTVELLAAAGVEELFVYSRAAGAAAIQEHLTREQPRKWPEMGLVFRTLPTLSVGDALRQVQNKGDIQSKNFLLVTELVVGKFDLGKLLARHCGLRATKVVGETSKSPGFPGDNVIMTSAIKRLAPGHRSRSSHDHTVMALDSQSKELLHFDSPPPTTARVQFDTMRGGAEGDNWLDERFEALLTAEYIETGVRLLRSCDSCCVLCLSSCCLLTLHASGLRLQPHRGGLLDPRSLRGGIRLRHARRLPARHAQRLVVRDQRLQALHARGGRG